MKRGPRRCRILSVFFALLFLAVVFLVLSLSISDETTRDDEMELHAAPTYHQRSSDSGNGGKKLEFLSCFDTKNNHWKLPAVPHFIIAGAQKGGTTALRAILVQHPQLIASMKFEPHYFDQRLQRYLANQYQSTDLKPAWLCDIQRHYIQTTFYPEILEKAKATPDLYFYEKTPSYLHIPEVPRLISKVCTWKPKIVVMLRDPIERAYSQYKMEREKKRVKTDFDSVIHEEVRFFQTVGISTAPLLPVNATKDSITDFLSQLNTKQFEPPAFLDQKTSDEAHNQVIQNLTYTNFLQRGMYSVHLERWLKHFSLGESLMVIKFEDFQANPAKMYKEILDFVGIPMFQLELKDFEKTYQTRGVQRQKSMVHPPISPETRQYLEAFFEPYNRQLSEILGVNFYGSYKS